jgi:hypothetical protein
MLLTLNVMLTEKEYTGTEYMVCPFCGTYHKEKEDIKEYDRLDPFPVTCRGCASNYMFEIVFGLFTTIPLCEYC